MRVCVFGSESESESESGDFCSFFFNIVVQGTSNNEKGREAEREVIKIIEEMNNKT